MTRRRVGYVIGAIAAVILLFTIQNFVGFLDENRPWAANSSLIYFGIPGLILAVVAVALIKRRP